MCVCVCVCVERERERKGEVYAWERALEYVKRYTCEHTQMHNEQAVLDVWYMPTVSVCVCACVSVCLCVCV